MNRNRSRLLDQLTDDESPTRLGRRRMMALGAGVGTTLLAGCTGTSGLPGSDGSSPSGSNFRLLISDMPADIGDFDRLDVTFDSARIFDGEDDSEGDEDTAEPENETETDSENETETESETESETENETEFENETESENETETDSENETDSDDQVETTEMEDSDGETDDPEGEPDSGSDDRVERQRDFYVLDLDGATVDLTQVVDGDAMPVFEGELSEGTYQKVELHVSEIEGIVDGEQVEVMVPSGKLQITKPFEIRAEEATSFVFDINVVKRGNQASYNLNPVISKSGVAGKDVEVEEVDPERASDDDGEDTESDEDAADDEDDGTPSDDEGTPSDDDGTPSDGEETPSDE
ncbi:DUF4382 domain-containing protein [Halopenitus sp. H-Gu1]|uniref:DUF4382 domain-containing protein n=1 Tax=Halopenitus sp. H-Gu1 TaxID=3242697 RepID=UPI00359DFBE0